MKKLFISVAIVAAGAFGIFQANQNNNQLSDLQMENVELLALGAENGESSGGGGSNNCDWGIAEYRVSNYMWENNICSRDCSCSSVACVEVIRRCK
ncbi:MAG: NVEALA domain-containing protein [Bacteroidales bacterium]|nr:NVEALA domain-containing protein [Bacteroidales bacterium]